MKCNFKNSIKISLFLFFLLFSVSAVKAQDPEEITRGSITSEDFAGKRSKSSTSPAKTYTRAKYIRKRKSQTKSQKKFPKPNPKPANIAKKTPAPKIVWEELGFTLWRLRKKSAGEDNPSLQVFEKGVKVEYVPERVESDTILKQGDKVRLTVESPRDGYLYIIDREQYSDGTFGEPLLIFPTQRTRGGQNRVGAGILIDIPSQDDDTPFFVIQSNKPNYRGEMLSVIISDKPLSSITIPRSPISIQVAQFEDWSDEWGLEAEVYELTGGNGSTWTAAEKEAAKPLGRALTQGEPTPQTIYRFSAKEGVPILVNFSLTVEKR